MSAPDSLVASVNPGGHLKVLMVNKFLYPNGGSETYMLKLGEHLVSQGHEVQYFGMEHEKRTVGNRVNAYTSNMDFHGGSAFSKATYPVKTIYSVEARKKIRQVLEDFQPDIVHLNNFNYQLTPSIILEIAKWRETDHRACSILYTAHDYQLVCPNHMLRNPNEQVNCEKCLQGSPLSCIEGKCIHGSSAKSAVGAVEMAYWNARRAYQHIDAIICPSEFVKSKIDANPTLRSKTVVVPNFVDVPEHVEPVKDDSYVLYYGRLTEEKGVGTLLKACELLPEIPFVLIGDGPLLPKAEQTSNVRCLGFLQGDELWGYVAGASFCVCPSECYETFCLAVGESMTLGTPVIASEIGGIPELIEKGVNGELIEPGDAGKLSEAISSLWHDRGRIDRYSRAAKTTWHLSVDQYREIVIDSAWIHDETSEVSTHRLACANHAKDGVGFAKQAVLVADNTAENLEDFLRGLNEATGIEWTIRERIPSDLGTLSKTATLRRYAIYFTEAWRTFLDRDDYFAIIGWQQFYALIFALYCDLFKVEKSFFVCALNSVYKRKAGLIGDIYHSFMRVAMNSQYVDYMQVSSEEYIPICGESLRMSDKKLFYVPYGVSDLSDGYDVENNDGYALAIGRSNRDFNWLVDEWRDIDTPLIIISDSFKPRSALPSNVVLLDDVTGDAQYPYFAGCKILIMPIDDPQVTSGDTVLLTGMSFGKTVIVTTPSALGDTYIVNGVNGHLCSKEHGELARLVNRIEEEHLQTGKQARKSFVESYSLETMGRRVGAFLKPRLDEWMSSQGIVADSDFHSDN